MVAIAIAERLQRAALRAAAEPLVVTLLCVASVGIAAAAHADERASYAYELPNELMSPWCPGFSLADCGSGYAAQLRAWILEQEERGRPREEVEADLLARYGEKIRQAPKAEGRAWFAYAIPAAAFAAGAAVVVAFLRRQGRRPEGPENPPVNAAALDVGVDVQLASRVDAEIASYEASHSDS